jgi:hypothetical protein
MNGNDALARLMLEAGFLKDDGSVGRKVFARAVGRHSDRSYTHTYVGRWLDGSVPRDATTRTAIAATLGDRLGRTVTMDELGFVPSSAVAIDLGLLYPHSLSDGIDTLTQLWRADRDGTQTLTSSPVNVGSWSDVALSWLVNPSQNSGIASTGDRKVGMSDVNRMIDAITRLWRLCGGLCPGLLDFHDFLG